MATAKQCRAALECLAGRLRELDSDVRRAYLAGRTLSCHVPDLGVTFLATFAPHSAEPVVVANDNRSPAQLRFTVRGDDVLAIAHDPASFARAWDTRRLSVEGSFIDLLLLRSLAMNHRTARR